MVFQTPDVLYDSPGSSSYAAVGGRYNVEATAQKSLNKGLFRQTFLEHGWLWQKFAKSSY